MGAPESSLGVPPFPVSIGSSLGSRDRKACAPAASIPTDVEDVEAPEDDVVTASHFPVEDYV